MRKENPEYMHYHSPSKYFIQDLDQLTVSSCLVFFFNYVIIIIIIINLKPQWEIVKQRGKKVRSSLSFSWNIISLQVLHHSLYFYTFRHNVENVHIIGLLATVTLPESVKERR